MIRRFCVWYVCWVDYIGDDRWKWAQHVPFLYRIYKWADKAQWGK